MDLTSRKNKFIEQFMKLTSLTKIKRLEEVLHAETNEKDYYVERGFKYAGLPTDVRKSLKIKGEKRGLQFYRFENKGIKKKSLLLINGTEFYHLKMLRIDHHRQP